MEDGDFWTTAMDKHGPGIRMQRIGVIRLALLFGTAAMAIAIILTPILAERTPSRVAFDPGRYDNITTGSIPTQAGKKAYTIRKSILQDSPDSVCIIQRNGLSSGDC